MAVVEVMLVSAALAATALVLLATLLVRVALPGPGRRRAWSPDHVVERMRPMRRYARSGAAA